MIAMVTALAVAPTAAAAAPPKPATYTPSFAPMGGVVGVSELVAAGNFTLTTQIVLHSTATGASTLIDQQTGASSTFPDTGGCGPYVLGVSRLLHACPTGDGEWAITAYAPPGSVPVSLGTHSRAPTFLIGRHWVELTSSGAVSDFLNITTGQEVADRSHIGGRLYPDLDSPTLFRAACPPIRLPALVDNGKTTDQPAFISFYGSVAVSRAKSNYIYLQRCGTSRVTGIYTGANVADNNKVFVWLHTLHNMQTQISGIIPATERRFSIVIPAAIPVQEAQVPALAINNQSVYLTTRQGIYSAALPAPLK
jgi:hypothetical protein